MKTLYSIIVCFLITTQIIAQIPAGINYQVVLRTVEGDVLSSETATVNATITDGAGNSHSTSITTTSDNFGVINVIIGSTDENGELLDLEWGEGNVTLSVNVSSESGSVDMGTTQLLSVPFAFYAANSGSSEPGPQGDQGTQGTMGTQGEQGVQGEQGFQGANGEDGAGVSIVGSVPSENDLPSNYQGDIGDMYIIENTGEGFVWDGNMWNGVGQIQGPQGIQGIQGNAGPQGDTGIQGQTGATGQTGQQGIQGESGAQGETGLQGQTGSQGQDGPQGIQGEAGQTGATGQPGPQGIQGETGSEGPQGETGPAGTYSAGPGITLANDQITNTGDTDASDDVNNGDAASGDLAGTYPNPSVDKIKGLDIIGSPSEGTFLKYFQQSESLEWVEEQPLFWSQGSTGIEHEDIIVNQSEIFFGSAAQISLEGFSTNLSFQFNNVPKLGFYNSSDEFGPVNNNDIQLGSSPFRWSEIWSVNGINQSSDRRLKKNIHPLNYGLKKVMAMNPVSYKWKQGSDDTLLGFIAQDMEKIIPEVVQKNGLSASEKSRYTEEGRTPSDDMYAMNYSELIPVLVKAIQEQQAEIEILKSKITDLEK
ncbi:MAG: hypothetical protein ACI86M_001054 [Saprospiraceae bacterium]|jgi:hypothetical protein